MNRLARERSPYLLQHAGNPVDWYAWGEEAFARARREDKPIFLSIGYSTCHWCHVMEHESFENPALAELLNRDFVSIKVDREERPDVDRVYMSFVQATTGSGGWPMTVFLTPELKPFFGGTYFPPASRWGRPGFSELLGELARAWKDDRARVEEAAAELLQRLRMVTGTGGAAKAESEIARADALDTAVEQFQRSFDRRRGGFGDAPKFPRPSELLFLLREHARRAAAGVSSQAPLLMATETLRAMALGGMRDHVGGGFHRYSVDGDWRVPHFEKMLYDQAQLVLAYLKRPSDGDASTPPLRGPLAYVRRNDRSAGGLLFGGGCRQHSTGACRGPRARSRRGRSLWPDDESAPCWAPMRTSPAAGSASIRRATPSGSQQEFTGRIFSIPRSRSTMWRTALGGGRRCDGGAGHIRERLFAARAGRPRPHLDYKILTAWNGLRFAAFARAARVLVTGHPRALSRSRHPCGVLHQADVVGRGRAASPLSGRRGGDRRIRRRLRVPDLGTARARPGERSGRVARVGADAPGAAGREVLGREGGRLVQYGRRGSDGPAPPEGRLRRRGTGGELGWGSQHVDHCASDRG